MYFNSLAFAIFLPATLALYWLSPRRGRTWVLLVASCVFYSWWDFRFLSLIVVSTLVDYFVGRRLFHESRHYWRKALLGVSLATNLGILGFFKYFGFFTESASDFLVAIGLEANFPMLQVVLPVGISFYTFQTLAYTIDVYRRDLEPEPNVARFALFVAFFPQLVAGPIERASRLLPQLRELPGRASEVDWGAGATLIVRGLFRKVVIADGMAPIVNEVFATPQRLGGVSIALGVVAFSLQIYGDFAGYTDIARGTAKLFGVELMHNFRAPYTSRGFSEFWRRWHISLSTWLRDYLYIPLGGSRHGRLATYRNLMVTMLLGGLWHGAGWGFIVWGGLHGSYLVAERILNERRPSKAFELPSSLVFAIVTLTWIPFRARNLATAGEVLTGMLDLFGGQQIPFAAVAVALLGVISIWIDRSILAGRSNPVSRWPTYARGLGYGGAIVLALLFASRSAVPFIYFQF